MYLKRQADFANGLDADSEREKKKSQEQLEGFFGMNDCKPEVDIY